MKANKIIRRAATERGVYLWQVAERLKISEPTLFRRLRTELSADEQRDVLHAIEDIAREASKNE